MQLNAVCLVFCLTYAVCHGSKKRFVVRLGGDAGSNAASEQCAKENPEGCMQVQLVANRTSCGYAVAAGKIYREGTAPRRLTASEKLVIEKYQRELEEYRKATSNSTNVAGSVTLSKLRKLPSIPQAPCLCSTCIENPGEPASSEQSAGTDSQADVTTDTPNSSAVTDQPTETQKSTKRPRRRGGKRRTGGSRKTTTPRAFGETNEPVTNGTPNAAHSSHQDATSRLPRKDRRSSTTTESWITKAPRGTNSRGNGGQDVTIKVVVDVGKAAKRSRAGHV